MNSMERRVLPGPALAAALIATTPEVLGAAGTHDALVIGSGAAGGLAALLLAESGLRVLVLEAGSTRSPTVSLSPAAVEVPDRERQPIQSRSNAWKLAPEA